MTISTTPTGKAILIVVATVMALAALYSTSQMDASAERPHPDIPQYQFTKDWTNRIALQWKKNLAPLVGKPNLRALEIGAYEGRTTVWALQHILTHPTATITVIDPWGDGQSDWSAVQKRFDHNIEVAGITSRVTKIVGYSQDVLPTLLQHTYDLIYIDGCHAPSCVSTDTVYSWKLLKVGGYLIWDDYRKGDRLTRPTVPIDQFLDAFSDSIEILHRDEQVIIRKTVDD